jgi:branched-chain amino acid transport system permease protein
VSLLANILMDGIAYGMVLFIISAGLSITLGLMRFVNLAHGAFAMVGGYIAAWLVGKQGWGLLAATVAALLATALIAGVLEALVLRRLYRKSELQQVLFTIGLTFLFVAGVNLVFGPQVQMIALPPWLASTVDLGFRTIPAQRLLVIGVGVAVLGGVYGVMNATRFGVWLRATVDNTAAAQALGIPVQWVYAITFAAGAALAALGGILGAELMPLEPFYPVKYLVLVLVVVAVGGMGSIAGSAAAAVGLGIIETASKYLASDWGSLFFFAAVALLLAWRPDGILSRRAA